MSPPAIQDRIVEMSEFFLDTLPETNSSPLKMDGCNTTFPIGEAHFQGLR